MDTPTPPHYIVQYPARPKSSKLSWFILFFLIGDMVILLLILNWLASHSPQAINAELILPGPSPTSFPAMLNPLPTVTPAPTSPATPTPVATATPTATPLPTATPQPTATPKPTPTTGPVQLLINPNFEQSWTVGWKMATGDDYGGSNNVRILQHPAISTNALNLDHSGQTFAAIYQVVRVSNLRLKFSGQLAAYTSTNGFFGDTSGLAGLGLNFYYNDPFGLQPAQPAGSLIFATGSKFEASRAFGLFPLTLPGKRGTVAARAFDVRGQSVSIANLQTEVQRSLPNLNWENVSAVGVTLFTGGSSGCKDSECVARLYAGNFSLQTFGS